MENIDPQKSNTIQNTVELTCAMEQKLQIFNLEQSYVTRYNPAVHSLCHYIAIYIG